MKTLIFGSRGYLGGYFHSLYPDAACPDADIADADAVSHIFDAEKPDVVINTAGRTGRPNVDWCEDHKRETIHSNVTGPLVLLEECGKRGIYWVHLGTGCVYSGDETTPFTEHDPPNFTGSFYSRTKGCIDQVLKDFPVLNIRLRMPFDGSTNERNLIMKLRNYHRVLDAGNSMTYIPDLLAAVSKLIEQRTTGAFNVVNPGVISPYRIMELYREIVDPSQKFQRLKLEDLADVAKTGRSNCVLATAKLEGQGISLRPVEDAVKEALNDLKKSRKQ